MEIKWHNIFGLVLLFLTIYLFVRLKPVMDQFLFNLRYVHYHEFDPLYRLLSVAILVLAIVAVVKLFTRK